MALTVSLGPDDWPDVLAWNLRLAGALWAAWMGGITTILDDGLYVKGSGYLIQSVEEKKPHLTLVP